MWSTYKQSLLYSTENGCDIHSDFPYRLKAFTASKQPQMAPAKRKRTATQNTTKKSQKKTKAQKAKTQPKVKVDETFADDNSKSLAPY